MNLEPIKEALNKATSGREWTNFERFDYRRTVYEYDRLTESTCDVIAECKNIEMAGFIANAPEWLASLVAEVERQDRQLEEAQKTIATAYGIACEDFESVNQMELIRLTLGEFLQSVRGDQHE